MPSGVLVNIGSDSYTQVTAPNSGIVVPDKNMYVATFTRSTAIPAAAILQNFAKKDILGAMVEIGSVYNLLHVKEKSINPNIDSIIAALSQAAIPFGFYFDTRAASVNDIREEIYEISFVVRKYPPKLGFWLIPTLTSTVATNDSLLDEYYKRMCQLGFKNQLGIYATEAQLKKITWSTHQNSWWLWINKHYTKQDSFKSKMDPSIFDIG